MLSLLPVLFAIAGSAVFACWSLITLVSVGNRETRVHRVMDHLEDLRALLGEAEMRERDYLI
jgi:CHASE3 domain sensor protein